MNGWSGKANIHVAHGTSIAFVHVAMGRVVHHMVVVVR
jgi:hypothetical protein